jgi:hypothetical protein
MRKESDHYDPRRDSTPHACNDPSLSAKDFLYAIYRDPTFPLSVRINAAARLLPLTESVPRAVAPEPRCTIVIGGIPTEAQDHDNTNRQSFSPDHSNTHHPCDGHPGPANIETNTDPLSFDDIQAIKAVVQGLCPDADLSLVPDHLTLCECGHWMFYPCKCASMH